MNDAAYEAHRKNGLAWAVAQWEEQVKLRPLVNVHRGTLDGVWRQVIRYFGGDPNELIGSGHDMLRLAAAQQAQREDIAKFAFDDPRS